jgi:hypothetical protein
MYTESEDLRQFLETKDLDAVGITS